EIARAGRASILGLKYRKATLGQCSRRAPTKDTKDAQEHTSNFLCVLHDLRIDRERDHGLKCRVAAEYSTICVVRSRGYDTSTSTIVPSAPTTGASFGMTNPVYDGNCKRSTRATTSSRSAGSKCTP